MAAGQTALPADELKELAMHYEEAAELAQRYLDDYAAGGEPLALFPQEAVEDHKWCFLGYA